ncbi:MAG: NIPSNAP family protein [Planctomycetaceae bacterium]|nr:NIPSNAP family protein [Planctomycetaceae bacterium]MCB9952229.1 NIPSNAP family protein [Planctomycetaceae bacterium]
MIRSLCFGLVAFASLSAGVSSAVLAEGDNGVYELRIYTCEEGKLPALHERFRNHTMRIFEKHGMKNIGYWTPTDGPLSENTLVYMIRHESREAAAESWKAFGADPEWQAVAKESREKDGKILAKRPEVTYLTLTEFSPEVSELDAGSVFELRTYTTNPEKLDDLHTRFHDHTLALFKRHGMTNLWYFTPQDEERQQNTLVYFLSHKSREAAGESWKGFQADPEWQAARNASEADGPILAKAPDRMYLKLTDYSPRSAGN